MNETGSTQQRRSVDFRTRPVGCAGELVDPTNFWQFDWPQALVSNGRRAAADATRLKLAPLTLVVEGQATTLRVVGGELHAVAGEGGEGRVELDRAAFADLVSDRKTAMGLLIGERAKGNGKSSALFSAWDPVIRSALDGRGVYRPGEVALRAADGSPLNLDQAFRLEEQRESAAQFLSGEPLQAHGSGRMGTAAERQAGFQRNTRRFGIGTGLVAGTYP